MPDGFYTPTNFILFTFLFILLEKYDIFTGQRTVSLFYDNLIILNSVLCELRISYCETELDRFFKILKFNIYKFSYLSVSRMRYMSKKKSRVIAPDLFEFNTFQFLKLKLSIGNAYAFKYFRHIFREDILKANFLFFICIFFITAVYRFTIPPQTKYPQATN